MQDNLIIDGLYFDLAADSRFPLTIPEDDWQCIANKKLITPSSCSVYLLKSGDKLYVGTDGDGDRYASHKSHLKLGKHQNNYMQHTCNKHGLDSFYYLCLFVIPEEYIQYRDQIENSYI